MKRLIAIAALAFVAGCAPSSSKITFPVVPDELHDCTFHEISDGMTRIKVARCPNSTTSTTYQQGKTTSTAVVIDGVEYVKKAPQ